MRVGVRRWFALLLKDEIPESGDRLLPDVFFSPRHEYADGEITQNVIIHNHLAHIDDKLNMLGSGMERIWVKMGYHDALIGFFKRVILMVVGSAVGYATSHYWMPVLERFATGGLP